MAHKENDKKDTKASFNRRRMRRLLGTRASRRQGTKTRILKSRKPSVRSRLADLINKLPEA